MTHDEIKILISAYIDGEVSPSEKNIIEEHLSSCPECQKDYKSYKALSSSLSKWPDETLSPDEEVNVQKGFEQRRGPMSTNRTILILAVTLFFAVVFVSVALIHFQKSQLEHPAMIDTSVQNLPENSPQPLPQPSVVQLPLYQPPLSQPIVQRPVIQAPRPIFASIMKPQAPMRMAMSAGLARGMVYEESTRMGVVRGGIQSASLICSGGTCNPYVSPRYYPNDYWNYYPQPTPVEPYRVQDAGSNTEQYDRIYDNPFLSPKDDPLSTFSIDVDTGSFSNIRRFLTNGQKPPKDAVQIEELINYFSYDYPQPTGEDPFSVTTEVSTCPWNTQHQLALIGLQGKKIPIDNLPASNLVFLVDVSGSMGEEDKLPLVKSALHLLVEQLRPQDTVSIAAFAGSASSLLEATSGRDKDKIEAAIDGLEAGGSTNGDEGLQLAYKIAKENFIPNGNNRIIVTTDGDFNVGTTNDGDLVRMIEEKKDQGIYLSVFGFGMGNLKASRMEKLADSGHGNYDYIDSLNEARKEFEQQLEGTLYAIAKDVKVQVEFNPATVKAYRLIGYEKRLLNKEDFNNDKKDAGVIGSGHTVTALYEITPVDSNGSVGNVDELRYQTTTVNPSDDLMTIKLRYKAPRSDVSELITRTVNRSQVSPAPSENLRFTGAVAEFGMLLRDSEYKGDSSYLQVMDSAQKSIGTDVNGYRKDFLALVEKAGLMGQSATSPDRVVHDPSTQALRCNSNMQQFSNCSGQEVGGQVVEPSAQACATYCSNWPAATCAQWYYGMYCNCTDGTVVSNQNPQQYSSNCSMADDNSEYSTRVGGTLRCNENMRQFLGCSGPSVTRGGIEVNGNTIPALKQACAVYCGNQQGVTCAQMYNADPIQGYAGCNCSYGSVVPNPNPQAGGSQYASSCTVYRR